MKLTRLARRAVRACVAEVLPLENRRLFAFSYVEDFRLFVTGTDGNDTVLVQRVGETYKATLNGKSESHPVADVFEIEVNGLAGNDTLTSTLGVGITIYGNEGNDKINGGSGDDYLNGGDDNDTVFGNGGNDELADGLGTDSADGGSGDDTFYVGTTLDGGSDAASDTYAGGSGADLVGYDERFEQGVNVTLDGKKNDGAAGENDWIKSDIENVNGGYGDDTITGNDGPNRINSGGYFGGNDSVFGLGGDDDIVSDYADPGLGNDTVLALTVDYSKRTVPLSFKLANDPDFDDPQFTGGQAGETDTIDTAVYIFDTAVLLGSGNDTFVNANQIRVEGNGGRDTLSSSADSSDPDGFGTFYPATLSGGAGDDKLTSGGSTTVFRPGAGKDTIVGSGGQDVLDYSDQTVAVVITYDNNDTNDGPLGKGDKIDPETFESILTGSGNDTLTGNNGHQFFDSGAGNDRLIGLGGNDTLIGGAGADTVNGGKGADQMYGNDQEFEDPADVDTVDYSDRTEALTLTVGTYAASGAKDEGDTIDTSFEVVLGGSGNDTIRGEDKRETLVGNGGNDTITGNGGDDSITGNDGDDSLNGGSGVDTVRGGNGRDAIDGGVGKDKLYGDAGNDVLISNDGAVDTLDGGVGGDVALADKGTIKDQIFAVETLL